MSDFTSSLDGAPVAGVAVSFTFALDGAPLVEQAPPNPLADVPLLAVAPHWRRPVELTLDLPVERETGLTGRERRRPRAATLRATLDWEAVLTGAALGALRDRLQTLADARVITPCWPLAVPGAQFSAAVHCSGGILCGWKADGSELVAMPADQFTPAAWDWVAPGLMGRLILEPAEVLRPDALRLRLRLEEDAPAQYALLPPAQTWATGPALNDTTTPRVFPWAVHAASLEADLPAVEITRRRYGPGRQAATEYYPQHARRGLTASLTLSGSAEIARLLAWWRDAAAEAEPHYVAWPLQATHLTADAAAGATTLALADAAALGDFRYLALIRPGATEIARVQSLDGNTATLTAPLTLGWPAEWSLVALSLLARHRDPELRLRCDSPLLAHADLAWLEVPEEYQPASGETRGTTLGRDSLTAWLYTFTEDRCGVTTVSRYTSYEADLSVSGQDYTAHPIEHTELRATLDLQTDEVTLRTRWLPIFDTFRPGRLDSRLLIEIAECTVAGDQGLNPVTRWTGEVVRADFDGPFVTATARGLWALLDRPVPRLVIQPQCNHTVFDARCGLSRTDWTFTATLVSASGASVTLGGWARPGGLPAGWGFAHYFALGYLERPTGERIPILDSTALNAGQITLTLDRPPASPWSAAEPLSIVPGCDGRRETCRPWHATTNPEGKFDNYARFGGFPFVPAKNPAFTPPKRTTNTAGKK